MKWGFLLFGTVVAWLLNAWYFLILIGVVHSWWTLVPTMGWHTSLVVSGLIVIAAIAGKVLGAFVAGGMEEVK
jgi:hypothetical protein